MEVRGVGGGVGLVGLWRREGRWRCMEARGVGVE